MSKYSEKSRQFRALRARMIKLSPWCVYCGAQVDDSLPVGDPLKATVDHLHPKARGGARVDERNLAVACFRCNRKKGARILSGPDPAASRAWL